MEGGKSIEGIRFTQLEKLEQERLLLLKLANKSAIGLAIFAFLFIGTLASESHLKALLFLGLMIYLVKYLLQRKETFIKHFKLNVITAIVQHFNLTYSPRSGLPMQDFYAIYDVTCESWRSEDLIYGEVDGVKVEIADVIARKMQKDTKIKPLLIKDFSGILLKATFPKQLTHHVYVCDKDDFGVKSSGDKAVMDNAEFNRHFNVFSDDQIMARYALTPALMETLCALKHKFNCPISLVFEGQEIRLAINLKIDSFEPNFQVSLLEDEVIKNYISSIKGFIDMVKSLRLNPMIWQV
jgi:Protein of unknown function (DUF3137).